MPYWIDAYKDWLNGLPADDYWILLVILFLVTVGGFYAFVSGLYKARMIENVPTSLIRSASQGYVELEGWTKLLPGPQIFGPLTSKPCVWYSYTIERRNDESWSTVRKEVSGEIFCLDDTTGECVIDPDGAEVVTKEKDVWRGSSDWPVSTDSGNGFLMSGKYRYTEKRLLIDGHLYAIGYFQTQGTGFQNDINEDIRDILREWKKNPQMMKAIDKNKDGTIDQEEWDGARQLAETAALKQRASGSGVAPVNIMSKPIDRRPFILSSISQDELTRSYHIRKWAGIAAFLIAGSVGTLALLTRI